MALAKVSLTDKYELDRGRVYLTGVQALVRLPIMQRQRDAAAGLNTGCFISGYRGSPLGSYDQQLWQAKRFLKRNNIHFQPGVNEDMAATALWGSQQVNLFKGATVDGVFGVWYGKGPGVDRSGDVLKHANNAGTSPHGGVLALAGDDHTCKSSTLAHQSEYAFMDASIPVLHPSGVQEILDYGLYGWAMSRYSGLWVALKAIAETMDSSASVQVDPERVKIVLPADFEMPPGGLNIRWPDPPLEQEMRLHKYKLYAALAFARANKLDRTVIDSPKPRFGIVTTGKSYLDVMQALEDLGIDEAHASEIGLRVYKVGMVWPLEREGIRHFAEGLEEILVVEEKRAVIENQMKEQLYNWREDVRPRVIGKFDEQRNWILPSADELTPARIARVIAARIARFYTSERIRQRLAFLEAKEAALAKPKTDFKRTPWFCSGCPHNTSTKVPEGSRAVAGIGCHYMAVWMDRKTDTFTQMGGEGASWIGQAPFTETQHIFANLGDGTYNHSGILAIRAAVAADVNITYKLLYNDAVAMTGGQPADNGFDVPQLSRQLAAEGVKKVVVVADDPEKYPLGTDFAPGVTVHHRDELDAVQRDLREVPGVTALIYDQTCAAEKRRRRKRGTFPDPDRRVVINELVCEGCGDCGVKSNCVSVVPVETEFGRKRALDQSSCNKDFSCVNGFCPSFVSVEGGNLKKRRGKGDMPFPVLPEPTLPSVETPYGILVTGIGGTGVVTIGALLGMAAHIEGKGIAVLDQIGLAQKGGAVTTHVRIAEKAEDIHAVRIAAGGARAVIGCDLVVTGGFDSLAKMEAGKTNVVVNSHETPTGDFASKPDLAFPSKSFLDSLAEAVGQGGLDALDASRIATALLGDSIAANSFMMGYAWQKGLIPLSREAIEQAIELNAVAVDFNKQAFLWGRRAAHDLPLVLRAAGLDGSAPVTVPPLTLEEMIAKRVAFLTDYQDAAYARRYETLVRRVAEAEKSRAPGRDEFARAVARYYFKLLAYKDEYEVARLYTDGSFEKQLAETFESYEKLTFHLAPPMVAERDPVSGHLKKRTFGPWMRQAFKVLAKLKGLRGTRWDVFGRTDERKMERQLIVDYDRLIDDLIAKLAPDRHAVIVDLASLPERIRGYGHVKEKSIAEAKIREAELMARLLEPAAKASAAD